MLFRLSVAFQREFSSQCLKFLFNPITRVEGGELFDKVIDIDKYEEDVAKLLFFQMATAIKVGWFVSHYMYI